MLKPSELLTIANNLQTVTDSIRSAKVEREESDSIESPIKEATIHWHEVLKKQYDGILKQLPLLSFRFEIAMNALRDIKTSSSNFAAATVSGLLSSGNNKGSKDHPHSTFISHEDGIKCSAICAAWGEKGY